MATTAGTSAGASSSGGSAHGSGSAQQQDAKRYYANVKDFIEAYRAKPGDEYTHTSLSSPKCAFYVPGEELSTFYSLYALALEAKQDMFVAEKNRHVGPPVVDLDFRFDVAAGTHRRHTPEQRDELARLYMQALSEYVVLPAGCRVFIMERDAPYSPVQDPALIKDGIHFVLPDVATRVHVKLLARTRFMELAGGLISSIGTKNPVHDVVDLAVVAKNAWLLHGSRKPGVDAYKISRVLVMDEPPRAVGAEVTLRAGEVGLTRQIDIVKLLSIRNKYTEALLQEANADKVHQAEQQEEMRLKRQQDVSNILQPGINQRMNTSPDVEQVRKLAGILGKERADCYNEWMRVGWCLRNIDHRLLDAWEAFSQKGHGYKPGECARRWNNMREGTLGIGSLHMWAKADNPDGYAKLMREDLSNLILSSISGAHYDVALVVHHMFKHKFVCSCPKSRTFYEYLDHRWQPSNSGVSLRALLSDAVWREFNIQVIAKTQAAMAATGTERDNLDMQAKKIKEVALKLRVTGFKENVLKELVELFYIPKFEDKLDSDAHLLGFNNGVFDLQNMEFREGRPEDYISFTTGIDYVEYDPNHPIIADIQAYFAQIHTDPALREYVLKLFASFLSGLNKEQKFYVWTGSGSNSKSMCVELFEKTIGDYAVKFPITLLTQKRAASNSATSELARAKGRRLATLQEPSEDEKLNIGLMKELSGGDRIQARALFKEPVEFKPMFKMLLLCNHLPAVPSDDGGTWRRIRVVEWASKFVEEPREPNEFKIDYELPQKMEHWHSHFMALLLQYYQRYCREGNPEPPPVLKCTMEYKAQNDHIALYLLNRVDKSENGFLPVDEVYQDFKAWLKDDGINMYSPPNKIQLEKYLAKNLCKVVTRHSVKGFKGYVLKQQGGGAGGEPDAIDA